MFVARRRETDSIPWPLVRSALDRGDLEWLRQNADRLAPVRLTDALRICLIIRDREPVQYERAAMRWLSRFALEARNATSLISGVRRRPWAHSPRTRTRLWRSWRPSAGATSCLASSQHGEPGCVWGPPGTASIPTIRAGPVAALAALPTGQQSGCCPKRTPSGDLPPRLPLHRDLSPQWSPTRSLRNPPISRIYHD